jgi:uncharacterized alkaline shock family protein YloU
VVEYAELVGRRELDDHVGQCRVRETDGGLALELHVVVDHGINLAEVTAMVQSRVTYEVERHTGLDVKAVDVHVDSARRAE